jgi:cytochrome c oxidase cbb3-type subunit 3/ubiquinol-cytochrome c reductase cytochrome c subunit
MCAVCHGASGEGYRADAAPRLRGTHFLASVEDAFLKRAIAVGRHGTTMSAWARERGGPLTHHDVDAVVAYMRTWYRLPRVRLDRRPNRGAAQRGQDVYTRDCAACHGERGVGGPNIHIGSADLLSSASDAFLRYAIAAGRPGTPMPAFKDRLTPGEIDDLIALLREWQHPTPPREPVRQPPPPKPAPATPLALGPVPLNPRGPEPHGFKAHPDTTPADVIKRELDRGARLALLDARAPSDYMNSHIKGAVSVPFYDPSQYFDKLPKDAWLVSYCACPHAESKSLAQKLKEHGFKKVTVLAEGLGVWTSRKYPTATGEKP